MLKYWIVKQLNKKYILRVGKRIFSCQVGNGGIKIPTKKIEGDHVTPMGLWKLGAIYYRNDRILRSNFKRSYFSNINVITKNCGWCDDIKSSRYNTYVRIDKILQNKFTFENLWREDDAYDIVITINHNMKPIIKNKGSAIFIHCSFSDLRNTSGCVALKKKDLVLILKNLKHDLFVRI